VRRKVVPSQRHRLEGVSRLRAIGTRYLAADSAGAVEWAYPLSWDNASGNTVHGSMTLVDASGVGAKTWNFINSGGAPAWQIGLVSEFVQRASAGGAVLQDDTYAWSQNPHCALISPPKRR
jgi:hypothetical protein